MVRRMPIWMADQALENLQKYPEEVQDQVSTIVDIISKNRSADWFDPRRQIPDDAPEKVKNALALKKGRAFLAAITLGDDSTVAIEWFETNSRHTVFVYRIEWPVKTNITD